MLKFKKYKTEGLLLFLVLLTRIPFISKILYSWDAVQLSLALDNFNLQQHQPHPPGYILYVSLGKIFNLFFDNPNFSYILISIIASFFAILFFYYFVRLLFKNNKFALILSLILLFNPYFWFYGEVASTYIFDVLFSIIFAYLSLVIIKKQNYKYLYWFSFSLGISGGFRQSIIILFLPLWILALVILLKNKKINLKQILINILIVITLILSWFVPLIYLSGGWQKYWSVTNWQLSHASQTSSIFNGANLQIIWNNFKNIGKVSLVILNILFMLPVFLLFFLKKLSLEKIFKNPVFYMFLFWLIPSYFVYIFFHFGNPGYLMTVALSLIIIFSSILFLFFKNKCQNIFYIILIIILVIQILTFVLVDSNLIKRDRYFSYVNNKIYNFNLWYNRYGYQTIKNFDVRIKNYVDKIEEFNPLLTILVTEKGFKFRPVNSEIWIPSSVEYFRHLEYYLSEYDLYEIFWDEKISSYFYIKNRSALKINYSNEIFIPREIEKIIIVTDNIDQEFINKNLIQKMALKNNQNLFFIDVKNKNDAKYYQYKFIKE